MKPFNAVGAFEPTADEAGLRRLAIRSAGITVLSGGLGTAIQMVATVVLARLLSPTDFGVVAMVTTFSLLVSNFGLNGFTEATIQWDNLTSTLASNLFWINLVLGFLLAVAFASAGTLLAKFFGNLLVTNVAAGMSLSIVFTSISVQHLALLKRAMRFSSVSANEIVARVISVLVTIVLARAGFGYRALVAGFVIQTLSISAGAWILCRWIPMLPARAPETFAMVRFGLNVYGRFTMNYCSRNLDNLLVGWRFNASALGLYKKAYDLFALSAAQLTSPLTNVAVSALSRLRSNADQYRSYFLKSFAVVGFVGMWLGAFLTLIGRDLIRLLLGPGWETSGTIFMYFGPGIGVMLLYGTHGWIHLSLGRADRWLRWGIFEFLVTGLLFLIGLRKGPVGVAIAWTVSFWILSIPALWYAGRPIRLGILPAIAEVWRYIAASVVGAYATIWILLKATRLTAMPGAPGAALRIFATFAVLTPIYFGTIVLLYQRTSPLWQMATILREMLPFDRFRRKQHGVAAVVESDEAALSRKILVGAPLSVPEVEK